MANDSGMLDGLSEQFRKDLKEVNVELLSMIQNIAKANQALSGMKTPSQSDSAVRDLTTKLQQQEAVIQKLQRSYTQLAESQARANNAGRSVAANSRQQSIAQQILRTETDRQYRATTLLGGAYARASAQLLILKKEAKDAAIQFGEQSKQAKAAAASAADLDRRIKSADAAVGDYQRNVGNYAGGVVKGFQGIFSVVRQLAYILPGIGIAGIFSLALDPLYKLIEGTGILSDNMLEVRKNTEAYHQTLLNIKADNRASADSLEALVKTATNGLLTDKQRQLAVDQLREKYQRFFAGYTDGQIKAGKFNDALGKINTSLEAQNIIQNQEQYKKTTDDRILAIRAELAERKRFREEEEYFQKIIKENTFIQNEGTKAARNALNETGKIAERDLKNLRRANDQRKKNIEDKNDETLLYKSDAKLLDDIVELEERRGRAQEEIVKQTGKALLLGKEAQKSGSGQGRQYDPQGAILDARIRWLKELTEATNAEYEAQKATREKEIANLNEIATDEKRTFEARINAYGEMLKKRQDLLADDLVRTKAQLTERLRIELEEADKAYNAELKKAAPRDPAKRTKEQNAAILKITELHEGEKLSIRLKFQELTESADIANSKSVQDIAKQTSDAMIKIEDERQKIILSTDKTYRDEQIAMFKKTADNEKLSLEVRQAAFRASMSLRQKQLDLDRDAALAQTNGSREQYEAVKAQFEVLQRALDNEGKETSPFAKALANANQELKNLKDTVTSNFLGNAGFESLTKFFDGTFDKVMDGFDLITKDTQEWGDMMDVQSERALKKFQYVFQTIGEIAKTVFSAINSLNQANFDAQYERLEKQKEVAIKFAGEGEAARAEIERKYEARRRQIQRQEAKAKRDAAIFEATINTAVAVVEALPNYVLAGLVAALGAFQIAVIASEPLPQYYSGRKGGGAEWAITQDRYGREMIKDKDGKIKSLGSDKGAQVTWLDKGDTVLTNAETRKELSAMAFNSELNGIMSTTGILPSKNQSAGYTEIDYFRIGKEMRGAVSDLPILNLNIDKDGFGIGLQKGLSKTNYINNRISVRGKRT